ncbi:MAG: type I restriction enzyme HsdR N-terminal domain-containing protein [bacterium]
MSKQIVKGIRKYIPVFQDAKEKDMNEADCVTRIIKFLEEVLEYDVLQDITKEFQIKSRYVDLGIKVQNKIKFYVEAKSANTKLKESHIYQAESYASQSGTPWVVLTNGIEWQLYHLVFDKTGIDHSMIFSIDLINGNIEQNADKLYYLSKTAFQKDEIEDYWTKQVSLSSDSLIKALFHEDTLSSIRRELRRMSDILVGEDEVLENVRKLLKDEILAQHGEMIKIRRRRKPRDKSSLTQQVEQKTTSIVNIQTDQKEGISTKPEQ